MMYRLGGLVFLSWERSPNSGSSPQGFDCNLITAFEERGTPVKGYCNYCLHDYTLAATADSFVVESWQSLGRYDRPQDALTDEPLDFKDLPLEDRHWMLFPGRIITPRIGVALMGGELVYHQPIQRTGRVYEWVVTERDHHQELSLLRWKRNYMKVS